MKTNQENIRKAFLICTTLKLTGALLLFGALTSCEDFVKIENPRTQLISGSVFSSDATASAALTAIYSKMMESAAGSFASLRITKSGGLSADEFSNYSTSSTQGEFFANALSASNPDVESLWSQGYQFIYHANSVLEGLERSTAVSPVLKKQLEGEAKFIRGFSHFYLVNLFGDVPYITTTDYKVNSLVGRMAAEKVYELIIADLLASEELLSTNYFSAERVRPNQATASAMLSRVYLYTKDFRRSEAMATKVIDNAAYRLETDLDKVFLKGSAEAIWQLMPVYPQFQINTWEGYSFILTSAPTNVALSSLLVDSFETNDKRKSRWINSFSVAGGPFYYPFKYKVKTASTLTEYHSVFRLAEQYLVRAEARAGQGNFVQASEDLNKVRNRAGLPSLSLSTLADFATALENERRAELFCEWGHRWMDLKRTGRIDIVMSNAKPGWESTDALYPIPRQQILNDPAMAGQQNPGY